MTKKLAKSKKTKLDEPEKFRHFIKSTDFQDKILFKNYKINNDIFEIIKVGDIISAKIHEKPTLQKNVYSKNVSGKIIGKYKHFFSIQEHDKTNKISIAINDIIDHTIYIRTLLRKGKMLINNNSIVRKRKETFCGLQLRGE